MHTPNDWLVNGICVALMLVTVAVHVWALARRYRIGVEHLTSEPATAKKDMAEMRNVGLTGMGMAIVLGIYIALLLRR